MDKMELTFTKTYLLTAGECNAQGHMPMTLLATRIIEVASLHANALNIGYDRLCPLGIGWVLSSLTMVMYRQPGINKSYRLTTWVEEFNRLYSDRCFEVTDADGLVIGHARSTWAAIDMAKRCAADLSSLNPSQFISNIGRCPLPRRQKLPAVSPQDATLVSNYTFQYCDIDFNGHVNTVRYIEHILNLWSPQVYASHPLQQMQISFLHECRYGQEVTLRALESTEPDGISSNALVDIENDGVRAVAARLSFRPMPDDNKV